MLNKETRLNNKRGSGSHLNILGSRVPGPNYNQFQNILRFFDVLPNFPFIASETMHDYYYKHGIYKLPHELPSNLRLTIVGNKEISGKCLNFIE